jgi:hypothetical protein
MATDRLEVQPMDWEDEFLPYMRTEWKPGEHVAVIAPTGEGKTIFVGGLIEGTRKYSLILDVKGGDSSLETFGWPRIEKWPGAKAMGQLCLKNDEENLPSRFLIGNRVNVHADTAKLVEAVQKALYDAFEMRHWTVYADELLVLTDPRQKFDLRPIVDEMLVTARDRGISFIGAYQQPNWVTPMMGRMATWVAVARNRNRDVVNELADILGRPKAEIRGAIKGLEKYHWILAPRDASAPLILTNPTYTPKKVEQ